MAPLLFTQLYSAVFQHALFTFPKGEKEKRKNIAVFFLFEDQTLHLCYAVT